MRTVREVIDVLRAYPAMWRAARAAWENETPEYRAAWKATPFRERRRVIRELRNSG